MQQLKLCLDLGASNLKGYSFLTNKRFERDNCISPVDKTAVLTEYYTSQNSDDITNNLDLVIEKTEGSKPVLTLKDSPISEVLQERYLIGYLAKQYSLLPITPQSTKPKVIQQTTYVNMFSAIIEQILLTPALQGASQDDIIDVKLGILLPPREYMNQDAKGLFCDNIAGTYKFKLVSIQKTVTVHIAKENIIIGSECAAALGTFIFDTSGNIRQQAKKYLDGNVLAVDGGRSTTDVALINNGKPVVGSYFTIPFGGNTVVDFLNNFLSSDLLFNRPSDTELEYAVKTGFIKQGTKSIDVGQQLINAKREYVKSFVKELLSYMTAHRYSPQSIQAILFIGGAFLPTEDKRIPSAGDYVMATYKQLSPYTEQINLEDPRYANLEGIKRKMLALEG